MRPGTTELPSYPRAALLLRYSRRMVYGPDNHGSNPPAYVRYAEGIVDVLAEDLTDSRNRGEKFDARTFPIADLVAEGLRDDEIIAASPEEIEDARRIAKTRWAEHWGFDQRELKPGTS